VAFAAAAAAATAARSGTRRLSTIGFGGDVGPVGGGEAAACANREKALANEPEHSL